MRISAISASIRKLADDHEHDGPGQDRDEGIGVEVDRERLHQHHDTKADQDGGEVLPRTPAEDPLQQRASGQRRFDVRTHRLTAPKVMPRRSSLRNRMVNTTIGTRNRVVPAATAGQSWPPSPMMKGMKGGVVCASPEVSSTAKAYSFQEKMRQKIAVAAMPVEAWGSTTFQKACRRL